MLLSSMENKFTYSNQTKRSAGSRFVLIMLLGWVVALGLLVYNRQGIVDAWRLHRYTAPTAVSTLATDDTMTPSARNIFYVNDPQITDKTPFVSNCPSGTEQTVVLGCYHGGQAGIFVLKVTDPRLDGVEQVTAAHEMLHAAYDRLSSRQKQSVNAMLQDFYDHGLQDDVVKSQIDEYKKSEPNDVLNEMHSLFGTEVAKLPANLENYYQRYFTDRQAITNFYATYQAEFTDRQNQIKAYDAQLTDMKKQIDTQETALEGQSKTLQSERTQLETTRTGGDIQAYNNQVASFNAQVDAYNAAASTLRAAINDYNALVRTRNAVAAETNELTGEISNQVPSAGQ